MILMLRNLCMYDESASEPSVHMSKMEVLNLHLLFHCGWLGGILALGADPFAVPVE